MCPPLSRLYGGTNDWAGDNIDTHYVSFSLGRDSVTGKVTVTVIVTVTVTVTVVECGLTTDYPL